MPKLCQILAIEKDLKVRNERELTEIYKHIQKEAVFNGRVTTYRPYDQNGEKQADQVQPVIMTADTVLARIVASRSRLYDIVFTKDTTNQQAKAVLTVEGRELLKDVPVTTLLYLDKQLVDLATCIGKIPTLPADKIWRYDTNANCYVTAPVLSWQQKKVLTPLVKAPATDHHPAQVDVVSSDVQVGEFTTVHQSGAIPAERKARILERIATLREAVKVAKEEANSITTTDVSAGKVIFDYLFKD